MPGGEPPPDTTPPTVTISSPTGRTVSSLPSIPVAVAFADAESGIDTAGLSVTVDGAEVASSCDVTDGAATCISPALASGRHAIVARIADRAGNAATASLDFDFVLDEQDPAITIASPLDGALTRDESVLVAGTVTDDGDVVSVEVNGIPASLTNGQFSVSLPLEEGSNGFLLFATDSVGRTGIAEVKITRDTVPPALTLEAPSPGELTNASTLRVAGEATDENGIEGVEIDAAAVPVVEDHFESLVSLAEGRGVLLVRATDRAGNVREESREVVRWTLPVVSIQAPPDLGTIAATTVSVSGTVSDPSASVTVNGIPAIVSGTSFAATDVPLIEGGNILTAVATTADGHVGTDSINVVRDLTAPRVAIYAPRDGATVFEPTVAVAGLVNDIVPGTVNETEVTVTVNGFRATVANRSFSVTAVPLLPGDNELSVVAVDESGNVGRASLTVHREEAAARRIAIVSGNHQEAVIGTALPEPLVVELLDATGLPAVGVPVIFKVRSSNGFLEDGGKRQLAVSTDPSGRAAVRFTLGTRAGSGNQTVEASAAGFAGPAVFTFTAHPAEPALLVVDAGDQQLGIAGQALPRPLVAAVTDHGFNRLPGVPVKLTVVKGQGHFGNGEREIVVPSDTDGRVIVPFVLDPEEGIAGNVVQAVVEGADPGPRTAFTASGWAAGDPAATSISGVVLDNTNQPIQGVTLRVQETTLTTQTDAQGQFRIPGAPVGTVKLIADGSTAARPGSWPDLEFVLTTIPGRDNTLGMPIYLLPLDLGNGLPVDETRGGTLTLPDVPGFMLEIAPGSVTFPGGSRSGVVSVTAVHSDKVPMVPNFGQQPRFIVTIQPAEARFDPPARITFPNLEGFAPGEVTELYSFDHDLGHFVSIGPGTVSEDGRVIVSNPGVGIVKAGWHCGGNPARAGTPHACPGCTVCNGSSCVPGCPLSASAAAEDSLKATCRCNDGKICTVNDTCDSGKCLGEPRLLFSVEGRANGSPTGRVRVNEEVEFEAVVTGKHCPPEDLSYRWNFGDGTSSQAPRPTHQYAKPATYRVEVQVDCKGCATKSDLLGVVVSCPKVRITRSEPDIEVICPGCEAPFFAETDLAGAPVYWMLGESDNLGGQATVSSTGLLKIGAEARTGKVVVRASALPGGEDCRGERVVSVFSPKDFPPMVDGRPKAERDWSERHPFCALKLSRLNLKGVCSKVRNGLFGEAGWVDSSVGNAFHHAYCSCRAAKICDRDVARELWDAHEEHSSNVCEAASIDFHNNEVGIEVSMKPGDCKDLVLEALKAGRLRWAAVLPPSPCPALQSQSPNPKGPLQ